MPAFQSIPKIDAHIHYNHDRPALLNQAKDDNFALLTINTDVPFFPSLDRQHQIARRQAKAGPGLISHLASFTIENWHSNNWEEVALNSLKKALSEGAAGVKVWKNIGMDLRGRDGKMVMIDDTRFDPILDYLENNDIPLIGHLGEPRNCWLPLDQMTVDSDKDYFREHPQYHMHLHPECPTYEVQIQARDRMLEKHPDLRFIGAHLASLEWDVGEVASRLDTFPKMAVDLAERICHLQYQAMTDRNKVIAFMESYQDRIIYGTDVIDDGEMTENEIRRHIHGLWLAHWDFFTTDRELAAPEFPGTFTGLNLSGEIIEKIYYKNAINWYGL
ncbi:MAG: amidohydrolase family protein [Balneolales bacterium]